MARTLVCLRYFLIGGAIVVGVCGVIESICAGYFIYQLYEYSPLTPSNVCGSAITLLVMGLVAAMIGWCIWQFLDFSNTGQVIIGCQAYWINGGVLAYMTSYDVGEWGNTYIGWWRRDVMPTPSQSKLCDVIHASPCTGSPGNPFSVVLIIVTVVNTSAGIWALVRHEQVDLLPIAHLEEAFKLAVSDEKPLWDRMHSKLHCCGINGPADYRGQDAIPWSCCDTSSISNSSDSKGACTTMYARGCQHVVINRNRSILLHIFLLALCTVLLQIGFIMCMSCYTRSSRERMERRKDLMIAAQAFARASKDLEVNDNFLSPEAKQLKASTDV